MHPEEARRAVSKGERDWVLPKYASRPLILQCGAPVPLSPVRSESAQCTFSVDNQQGPGVVGYIERTAITRVLLKHFTTRLLCTESTLPKWREVLIRVVEETAKSRWRDPLMINLSFL